MSEASQEENCALSSTDWLYQDDEMFQETTASLIRGDDDDDLHPDPDSFKFHGIEMILSTDTPTSVQCFDVDSRPGKRRNFDFETDDNVSRKQRKTFHFDTQQVATLPKKIYRSSWTRPVCTFLNYFGSRLPKAQQVEEHKQKIEDTKNDVATMALFPVCLCKLKHQVLRGTRSSAPPILQLLSATTINQPSTLLVTQTASESPKLDDLQHNVTDDDDASEEKSKHSEGSKEFIESDY